MTSAASTELDETIRCIVGREVDERKSLGDVRPHAYGKIQEIIRITEPVLIQNLHDLTLRGNIVRQVVQEQCNFVRARMLARPSLQSP
jgi:hypothetical protein